LVRTITSAKRLAHRFDVALELKHPVDRIHVVMTPAARKWWRKTGSALSVEARKRIGEPGAFDDSRRNGGTAPPRAGNAGRASRLPVRANGAAHATRLQQHHLIVETLDEKMVDPDFAQFVDDHRRCPQARTGKQIGAAASSCRSKKPGEKRHRVKAGTSSTRAGIELLEKFAARAGSQSGRTVFPPLARDDQGPLRSRSCR